MREVDDEDGDLSQLKRWPYSRVMRSRPWWWRRVGLQVVMLLLGIAAIIWGSETGHAYAIVIGGLFVVGALLVIGVVLYALRRTPQRAKK